MYTMGMHLVYMWERETQADAVDKTRSLINWTIPFASRCPTPIIIVMEPGPSFCGAIHDPPERRLSEIRDCSIPQHGDVRSLRHSYEVVVNALFWLVDKTMRRFAAI
jgi:hypothetical protein